jgi:nucleotide-binding universal stress UspA family protein
MPTPPDLGRELEVRRYLRGVADRLSVQSVAARWQIVADDQSPIDAIIRYAEVNGVDAIAMAGWGAGLSGLFRRSVAGQVARRAEVPVLLCRAEVVGVSE